MLSIYETARLLNRLKLKDVAQITASYSVKKTKTTPERALDHFDHAYKQIYGKQWWRMRSALLSKETKYIAVANNYGDIEETIDTFQKLDALDLKVIYNAQCEILKHKMAKRNIRVEKYKAQQKMMGVECSTEDPEEVISETLPDRSGIEESTKYSNTTKQNATDNKPFGLIELKSIEPELNDVDIQTERIIYPNSPGAISEFVPATEIKGFDDDWVLESEGYRQYSDNSNFAATIEKETVLPFPEHLKLFVPEEHGDDAFPRPKISSTGVLDYFLFDSGSILPVLALDLQPGDNVLDMCAGPGGKSLAILQTLIPRFVTCNDVKENRVKRIQKLVREYIPEFDRCSEKLNITMKDARIIEDGNVYNKILVDVPCSTDRHAVHIDGNTIFKPARIKERLLLPNTQAEILMNAISLVQVGGTIVYSTCTLNPLENDGAVQLALKKSLQENNHVMVIKDMTEALKPLRSLYTFGDKFLRFGHMVIPSHDCNCGPMYFCKMVKTQ